MKKLMIFTLQPRHQPSGKAGNCSCDGLEYGLEEFQRSAVECIQTHERCYILLHGSELYCFPAESQLGLVQEYSQESEGGVSHLLQIIFHIKRLHVQVAVLGGGSFATAMGAAVARRNPQIDVHMLMRGEERCQEFNELHENRKYLPGCTLPNNMRASEDVHSVLEGAQYVIHALPVQATRPFLASIKDILPEDVPIICVSKGIEQTTGFLLSEVLPSALGRSQPCVFLSGPSFAKEVRLLACSAPRL